jgi:hypothetical protein
MLTKSEFISELLERINEVLSDGIIPDVRRAEIIRVDRVGGRQDAIVIRGNGCLDAVPVYYINDIYADYRTGRSMDSILKELDHSRGPERSSVQMPDLADPAGRKNLVIEAVYGPGSRALLEECPNQACPGDISLIVRYRIGDTGSFIVKNEMLPLFRLTSDELIREAMKNTAKRDYQTAPLAQVLAEMSGMDAEEFGFDEGPWVLKSRDGMYAGAAIACPEVLGRAADAMGADEVYVLPSSVHELLLVRVTDGISPDELRDMVRRVNETEVSKDEWLSEEVFFFDAHSMKLSVCAPELDMTESSSMDPRFLDRSERGMGR